MCPFGIHIGGSGISIGVGDALSARGIVVAITVPIGVGVGVEVGVSVGVAVSAGGIGVAIAIPVGVSIGRVTSLMALSTAVGEGVIGVSTVLTAVDWSIGMDVRLGFTSRGLIYRPATNTPNPQATNTNTANAPTT
jgi:hypothetical protein